MFVPLLLVGVLSVAAYTVGYLVGRAETDKMWRSRTRFDRIGAQLQQAYVEEPGKPRMN